MKKDLFLVLLCMTVVGCSEPPTTKKYVVERIFQQQPGVYSFIAREGEQLISVQSPTNSGFTEYQVFADADSNSPMTVEVTQWRESGDKHAKIVAHIHSVRDIDATGYTIPGKPPQTVNPKVIE